MSVATTIEYPESDGRPMGETDLHRDWMVRVLELMRHRYQNQKVYVASDLLVYYEQGDPKKFIVPDDFVVLDCEPGRRRVFKIWEEGRAPNVVFEITSISTRNEDSKMKPSRYTQIGVKEYFLYDPTADYLSTQLLGFRLVGNEHVLLEADESGALRSEELQILLRVEHGKLVMFDSHTGQTLQTAEEAFEARAKAAEQEVQRLREELDRLRSSDE